MRRRKILLVRSAGHGQLVLELDLLSAFLAAAGKSNFSIVREREKGGDKEDFEGRGRRLSGAPAEDMLRNISD
jgi:hypothetical protein